MTKWIMDLINSAGYLGIVFLSFLENVFPPIPSEYIIPLAGFMVAEGRLSFTGVVIAGTVGSVIGSLPFYYVSRKIGERRLKNFADRHGRWLTLSREDIERANGWFDRYGAAAVFICRLLPGIRAFIAIPAGINRMNIFSYAFFTAIGSVIWTSVLAYAGLVLGNNFREIDRYFDPISYAVFGLIIVLYLWRVIAGAKRSLHNRK